MKKYALVFILGAMISFVVTDHLIKRSFEKKLQNHEQLEVVNSKLKILSETEYQEYLNLKDSEEKYKKADELLGKVMVLFLADLRLRLADKPVQTESSPQGAAVQSAEAVADAANSVTTEVISQASAQDVVSASAPDFKLKEQQLLASKNEQEAMKLLSELEIIDLDKQLGSSSPITDKQQNLVQGAYTGWIVFDDKNKERWQVDWTVDARWDGKKLNGKYVVILSDSQKGPFSRTNGNGEIKAFMVLPNSSNAVLVESYGGDGYMQLYPFADTGKIFGNYYMMQKDRSFKKVGIVILQKK